MCAAFGKVQPTKELKIPLWYSPGRERSTVEEASLNEGTTKSKRLAAGLRRRGRESCEGSKPGYLLYEYTRLRGEGYNKKRI